MRHYTSSNSNDIPFILDEGGSYPDREQYERELAERQRRHLQSIEEQRNWRPCLHDGCQTCHGTGVGQFGTCVHMLSCPCPKCSPYC